MVIRKEQHWWWFMPRDRDLLIRIARGRKLHQIADELGYSEQTLKNRMSTLYRRTRANSRAHLICLAVQAGLLTLDETKGPAADLPPDVPEPWFPRC